jgi:hypothetical protein
MLRGMWIMQLHGERVRKLRHIRYMEKGEGFEDVIPLG